jgi:ankyrin repeat protein
MMSLITSRVGAIVIVAVMSAPCSVADNAPESKLPVDLKRLLLEEQYHQFNDKLRPLAKQGNAAAQYQLGINYQKGLGLRADSSSALYWFELAARQQHAKAQFSAALLLLEKPGEQDRGRQYLADAAGNGHSMAAKRLKALGSDQKLSKRQLNARLCYAARHGDLTQLNRYLKRGASPNSKNDEGQAALHLAIENDQPAIVSRLLASGASVDAVDGLGNTALHYAAKSGYVDMLRDVSKEADLDRSNKRGDTALSLALSFGHDDSAQLLIRKGADPNTVNWKGRSPLDIAIAKNRSKLVTILERQVSKPTASSGTDNLKQRLTVLQQQLQQPVYRDWDTLMLAAWSGDAEMVKWLSHREGQLRLDAALLLALQQRHDEAATVLIRSLIDRQGIPDRVPELLQQAILADAVASFEILSQYENKKAIRGMLWESINASAVAVSALLIERGADVRAVGADGTSCLQQAARNGNVETIEALLAKKAAIDRPDAYGRTALFYAVDNGHLPAASALRKSGAGIDKQDKLGHSPLIRAVIKDDYKLAEYLVDSGGDTRLSTASGNSALMVAAEKASPPVIELLLRNDYDISHRNSNSLTALMVAVRRGDTDVIEMLLVAGADPSRRNRAGKSVLDMTEEPLIAQLLQQYD